MTSCASFSLLPQVSFSMRFLSRLLLQASDENKTQGPSPLIPFSSLFAFAKIPYLHKPFLVVHIQPNKYSDRYTITRTSLSYFNSNPDRKNCNHEARDYLPLYHSLLRPSICISSAIHCHYILSANRHDSLNRWKWNALRTSPTTWCVLLLLPANKMPPARQPAWRLE